MKKRKSRDGATVIDEPCVEGRLKVSTFSFCDRALTRVGSLTFEFLKDSMDDLHRDQTAPRTTGRRLAARGEFSELRCYLFED